MLKAITEKETSEGKEGQRILNNISKQLFAKGIIDCNGKAKGSFLKQKFKRRFTNKMTS